MSRRRWVPWLVLVVAVGTWLRWSAAEYAGSAFLDADEAIYLDTGVNAARLGILGPEPAVPSPERAPAVPSWIALSQLGTGPVDPIRTRHLQAVLCGLGVLLFFLFGAVLDDKRGAATGLAMAALYALHPDFINDAVILRTEWLDVLFAALIAGFLAAWARTPNPRSSFFFGLVVGAALMSRSFLFLLIPAAALARFPERRKWIPPLFLGLLIPLLPWAARNAVQFRAFIPFERGAAEPSLYYSSLGLPGSKGLAAYEAMALQDHPELAALDSVARMKAMMALARRNAAKSPGRFLRASLKRLPVIWAEHVWLLLFAAVGFFLARRRVEAWALAGFWGYYNLHMFVDIHLLRLHPGLVPLLGLCVLGLLEAPGILRRVPPLPAGIDCRRWGAAAALVLVAPALVFVAREGLSLPRVSVPEPKVMLDRVVLDARAGRPAEALARLDKRSADYPSYAALHVTHAALLETAGRPDDACRSLAKAGRIVSPLGAAGGELAARIRASLSACN